ncbi:MAG: hypothetical protein MZU95_07575 [Desulfomicrobium escambiense]|nr:hypothetical protein [Desulfomicrobium escambiense]
MTFLGAGKPKEFSCRPAGLDVAFPPSLTSLHSRYGSACPPIPTFVREWMFFASLFITTLLCANFFRRRDMFMLVLFGAGLNAALNIFFAEIQIRRDEPALVHPSRSG